ncbi:hypothetical protein LCGC14_1111470 [marine sediment metagenome]|uniref:Uncharacterized protein n=1 Tax=marine sediment metagenome TaxID=412755 RepID=A0A0F9PPP4_9ZZZZ
MEKKDFKNLISTYIRVILGFVGISSSLLITLLITYYFQFFATASDLGSLSPTQLSYIDQNLIFIIISIFTFISSLFISLLLFARFSFSDREINPSRIVFLLRSIMAFIFVGFVFLVLSLFSFLMVFIPNKQFIFSVFILAIFILFIVIFMIYIRYYL